MIPTLLPIAAVFGAVIGHALLIRVLPRGFVIHTLIGFIVITSIGLAVISFAAGWSSPIDAVVGSLLALSLGFAYLLLFVGIIHDSPTLALANAIADCGERGLPSGDISLFVAHHPFVTSRLSAMRQAGIVAVADDRLVLLGRVGALFRVCEAYRRLCARGLVGG
jgi:hypothetical protein